MKAKSKTISKLKEKKCKNCGELFSGRANQIYCSIECKVNYNNSVDTIMRKESRMYGRMVEKNLRILRGILKRNKTSKLIWKHDLEREGFNFLGPFLVVKQSYGEHELILGPYVLREFYDRYELQRVLSIDLNDQIQYSPS